MLLIQGVNSKGDFDMTPKEARETPPRPFLVMMCMDKPTPDFVRSRVGQFATMDECVVAIANDKKQRKNTFGGLIDSASSVGGPVTYVVWKATDWTRELVTS